jgi:hypothetical protein
MQITNSICREWKYFQYEPRTVRFPCESERVGTDTSPDPLRRECKLPQFSSAAIPRLESWMEKQIQPAGYSSFLLNTLHIHHSNRAFLFIVFLGQ